MRNYILTTSCLLGLFGGSLSLFAQEKIDFAKDILPVLEDRCIKCHGPEKQKGKLRLDTREFTVEHVVKPGDADGSELIERIILPPGHDDIMPPKGDPLTEKQVAAFKQWINEGAEWPEAGEAVVVAQAETAPEAAEEKPAEVAAADGAGSVNFEKQIWPILNDRCVECHGPKKRKGRLRLDKKEFAMEHVIVPGNIDESELVTRIKLPLDDDDVMPPEGEPLTKQQIELLTTWVSEGAFWPDDFVSPEEAARNRVDENAPALNLVEVPSGAKDQAAIAKIQEAGNVIMKVAQNVGWLRANFRLIGDQISNDTIAPLADIPNLVELNLANTKVTDEGLAHIAGLTNLTHLHLENTAVTDAGLPHLKGLSNLVYLNLYNTKVTDAGLEHLSGLANLRKIYLWQTEVTDAGVAKLSEALPKLNVVRGWTITTSTEEEAAKEEKTEGSE